MASPWVPSCFCWPRGTRPSTGPQANASSRQHPSLSAREPIVPSCLEGQSPGGTRVRKWLAGDQPGNPRRLPGPAMPGNAGHGSCLEVDTHTHTQTLTYPHILTDTCTYICTHAQPHSHTLTITHSHTHIPLMGILTHSYTCTLTQPHSHTHTTRVHTHTETHSCHTCTFTSTHSHSRTRTHTCARTIPGASAPQGCCMCPPISSWSLQTILH